MVPVWLVLRNQTSGRELFSVIQEFTASTLLLLPIADK